MILLDYVVIKEKLNLVYLKVAIKENVKLIRLETIVANVKLVSKEIIVNWNNVIQNVVKMENVSQLELDFLDVNVIVGGRVQIVGRKVIMNLNKMR
jgi:hypothetical protein